MGDESILDRIVIKPLHRSPFKYGSREVSNDDAIEIINQLINSVDVLIEIGDDTENWEERKKWLNSVLSELWKARGPYPGFASAMINMGLEELVQHYIALTNEQDMKLFRDEVRNLMDGDQDECSGIRWQIYVLYAGSSCFVKMRNRNCFSISCHDSISPQIKWVIS